MFCRLLPTNSYILAVTPFPIYQLVMIVHPGASLYLYNLYYSVNICTSIQWKLTDICFRTVDNFNYTFIVMNEKKTTTTFIFCLLTAGLIAQNPTLQWVTSQDGMGLEIPHDIKPSSDGNVFLFNDFSSSAQKSTYDPDGEINKGYSKTTDYFYYNISDGTKVSEKTSTGALDMTTKGGNKNMTLYKADTNGHLIWTVCTNAGYFDSGGAIAPTNDGGVVVALKMRHSEKGAYRSDAICSFVDSEGAETVVNWDAPDYETNGGVYQPVIAKISKDGKIEWAKRIPVDYKVVTIDGSKKKLSDNFEINDMVADGDNNLYLTGVYRTAINFGRNANLSSPHNVEGWTGDVQGTVPGDLFVVKLNAAGEAQWGVTTKGQITSETPKSICLSGENLYIGGHLHGDGEKAISLGTSRLVPTDKDCLFYACISTAGNVKWARVLKSVQHPVTQASARVKPTCISVSGNDLYLGGSFYGNIMEDDKVWLENDLPMTNGLRAYIVKCSAEDGTVKNTVKIDGGLTEVEDILPKDGKLLAPGYDLYGTSNLYVLDETLENLQTYPLKNSMMTATQGGILIGNRLISAMNANKSATFTGSDMTLEVINNGDANYRACVFTGHDISSVVTGIGSTPADVADNAFRVYSGRGEITVEAANACRVRVYAIDGRLVSSFDAPEGRTVQSLPAGLYIVNGRKVAVL